ncbi:MAG: PAS domain S-box protein, partial [Candidatus Hodarchaeota archaeon]
ETEITNLWNVFSQSEIPTLVLSKEGEIINYNDSMEKLTGYSHQEVPDIDAWFPKIYPDEECRSKVLEISRRSRNREITVRRDIFKITRKDGEQRFIEFSVYDIFHAEKPTNLQVVQGIDVTDQKETEAKLEVSRKHLKELVKKRTEELRESRDLYRILFESAPIAIGTSDFYGNVLTFNQKTIEMMGYTAEELRTIDLRETYVDPKDREEILQTLRRDGSITDWEVRRKRKDGSEQYQLLNSNLITLGEKQILLTTMRDITSRKKAEEALKESERKLQTIMDAIQTGIVIIDALSHRIVDINPMGINMIGASKEDILNSECQKFFCPNEHGLCPICDLGQKMDQSERILQTVRGEKIPVLKTANILILNERKFIVESFVDITERKQTEKQLRESEEKYRNILERITEGYYEVDLAGNFTFFNDSMCKILGYSNDEMLGLNYQQYTNDIIAKKVYKTFNSVYRTKIPSKIIDYEIIRKDGTSRINETSVSLIVDSLGEPVGFRGIVRDITERKQTEELLRLQRDLGIALSSTRNIMETLDLILDAICEIKGIDSGGIYLINKNTGDLHLTHSKGFKESFVETVTHIESKDHRAKLVMKGEPVYAPYTQVVPSPNEIELKEGILFLGIIPILFEEEVLAVLNVASHTTDEISHHTQSSLEAIATQIGSILELKGKEDALRESKEKYQMLVENLEEGVLLEDTKGIITFVNPKIAEILGFSMDEMLGQHWTNFVPKAYLELSLRETGKRPEGSSSSYEISLQAKDGTTLPVIVSATPIFSKENEFQGVVSVFTDISEHKQAEEEIRKERDLARKYLDTAGIMMIAINPDQNLTLINKKGCELLEYDEQEIIGKNWFDYFTPSRIRNEVKAIFNQVMAGKIDHIEYFENPIVTRSGEERIIGWHNRIFRDKQGTITGTLSSGEDITERIKAEKIRKELEEQRENFIYMTTHELRTPLTVIGGYCDFLIEHDEFIDHFRRDKIYTTIKSNVNRLERLTRDVSHIVQLERGEFHIEKKEINICSFLKSALEPYSHMLEHQFSFRGCPEEEAIIIQADPDRLQQVMENIISNAIKHTPKDMREIIVTMGSFPSNIQIRVSDNGAGIASEHLETIFEQFITIPTDYTAMGTGIGLYLAREIIKSHDGTITAQSEGKGLGSTFIIELPRLDCS